MLGVVNYLYNHLHDTLMKNGNNWSVPLGLKRSPHYGGQFNDNQCRTSLFNTDNREQVLQKSGDFNVGKPVLNAFIAFNQVKKSMLWDGTKYKLSGSY